MISKLPRSLLTAPKRVIILAALLAAVVISTWFGNSVFSSSDGGNTEYLQIEEKATVELRLGTTDTLGITDSIVVEVTRAD